VANGRLAWAAGGGGTAAVADGGLVPVMLAEPDNEGSGLVELKDFLSSGVEVGGGGGTGSGRRHGRDAISTMGGWRAVGGVGGAVWRRSRRRTTREEEAHARGRNTQRS
jgi:hypothetical protein